MGNENNGKKEQYFWNFAFSVLFVIIVGFTAYFFRNIHEIPYRIPVFDFVILALATFRLIRLFVYDYVTNFIRDYFVEFKRGPGKTISNLLDCPWCTGIWMAYLVVFSYFTTPLAWFPLLILALAGLATFIQITVYKIGQGL